MRAGKAGMAAMKSKLEIKKLGEVCDILDNKRKPITKRHRVSGEYPYYGATGILDYVSDYIFDEKLILIGEDGAKWESGENTAFIADGKYWVNNHAHVIRPHRDTVLDNWIVFFFYLSDITKHTTGLTVPKLNQANLRNIKIPIPPLNKQKQIVKILDNAFVSINKAKANAKKNLQNSRELFEIERMNIFNNILSNGEITYLEDIVINNKRAIKRGPFGSSITKSCFVKSGYKVYEQKNAINDNFSIGNYFVDENKYRELDAFKIVGGDIIISCSGTIGKVAIAPKSIQRGVINQALLKISLDETKMRRVYFKHFFENMIYIGGIKDKIKGAAIKNIVAVKELKQIPIPVPTSLKKQDEVITKLDTISTETKRLEKICQQKIADLNELKKSILQKAFNAELAGVHS
ncbi:restriction endonuclease subunit S [bacterium]|nr:restriction endonuclease subunit S [bacterium]